MGCLGNGLTLAVPKLHEAAQRGPLAVCSAGFTNESGLVSQHNGT